MVVHIHKENGHVTDQRTLDNVCAFLPNGDYVATIEPKAQWEKKQPRTLSQNALLHVWFRHIAIALNTEHGDDYWTAKRVKKYFAQKYADVDITPDGEVFTPDVETSKMTKKQMTDYMNKIQSYILTEHGIRVPLPDDDKFQEFQNLYS